MIYLLLVPLAISITLTVLAFVNRSGGSASRLTGGYALCSGLATAGTLLLATAPDQTIATSGSLLLLTATTIANVLLLPLIPFLLYRGRTPRPGFYNPLALAIGALLLAGLVITLALLSPRLVTGTPGAFRLASAGHNRAVGAAKFAVLAGQSMTGLLIVDSTRRGFVHQRRETVWLLAAVIASLILEALAGPFAFYGAAHWLILLVFGAVLYVYWQSESEGGAGNHLSQLTRNSDSARLLEQTRRHNDVLKAINAVSTAISTSLELDEMLTIALDTITELTGLDAGTIHLVDAARQTLMLRASRRLPPDAIQRVSEIGYGEGFSGSVWKSGQPLVLEDYATDERRLLENTPFKSFVCVPIEARGEVTGTLVMLDKKQRPISTELLDLLVNIGQQLAVGIDNARLLESSRQRVRHLKVVQEVSRDVTAHLDFNALLETVAERLWAAFNYYGIDISVREEEGIRRRILLRQGESVAIGGEVSNLAQEGGLIQLAARRNEPVLVSDVARHPSYIAVSHFPEAKAELVVPLMLAGDVLGILGVLSDRENGLTEADLEVLEPLAAQIAIALSNAQLFQTVRDYTAELEMRISDRTQRIREQQERTDAILRSVGDGVVVVNLANQIVLTNPVAEALLRGETHGAATGQPVHDFVMAVAGRATSNLKQRLSLESVTIEAHATRLVEYGHVQGTVIVLRDISREQELDHLKSQFVSTVSHELRTPMANLKLYLQLLQDDRAERKEHYLSVMDKEVARLEHLIDDLLDLSRLNESQATPKAHVPVDLNSLIHVVIANHEPQAEARQIQLQANVEQNLPLFEGNRNQLIQVFTNLIGNALAYTPDGGDVWVRTETRPSANGPLIIVAVEDSGVGIGPDELEHILDRFYRGKAAKILGTPGTGLGLAIVKDIVELHQGKMDITSAVGAGTTFTLTFAAYSDGDDKISTEAINDPG